MGSARLVGNAISAICNWDIVEAIIIPLSTSIFLDYFKYLQFVGNPEESQVLKTDVVYTEYHYYYGFATIYTFSRETFVLLAVKV